MITPEDLTLALARAMEMALNAQAAASAAATAAAAGAAMASAAATGASSGGRRQLDLKGFNDVKSFAGGGDEWSEWSFVFGVAVNAQSRTAKNLMDQMAETNEDEEISIAEEMGLSAELYQVLCLKCHGEPLTIVRGADGNGFIAWKKLFNRYNPRTVARAMMDMVKVLTPGKVTDIKLLEAKILTWEENLRKMERDHKETF